jgi:hypothetical protein
VWPPQHHITGMLCASSSGGKKQLFYFAVGYSRNDWRHQHRQRLNSSFFVLYDILLSLLYSVILMCNATI